MKLEYNHMKEFEWLGRGGIRETCGIVMNWLVGIDQAMTPAAGVADAALLIYGFPCSPMTGGAFEGDVYKFPSDPDMVPMLTVKMESHCTVHFYLYSMVAFEVGGVTTLYRMD